MVVRGKLGGTVIDGVCRDVDHILELKYSMFTRGHFMVTGKDRVETDSVIKPVSIANVNLRPGDLVVGHGSGVVIVPIDQAEEVLGIAKEVSRPEEGIEKEIANGLGLLDAGQSFRYHELQRPPEKK